MKTIKIVLNFLPIVGVLFAATYFFHIRSSFEIKKPDASLLILSYVVFTLTFISKSLLWYLILRRFGLKVHFKTAFVSQFRSILMKYIPGKIWIIIGRANIVSLQGYSLKYCSFISSLLQVMTIISGLIVGILGMLVFDLFYIPSVVCYIILFFLLMILFVFSHTIVIPEAKQKFSINFLQLIMGQKIPPVTDIILFSCLHWLLMGLSFFLFIRSIYPDIGFYPILLQPLANNIGIISPFAPGGLGVREGVMIGYLVVGGVSIASATSISLAARVWFFVGEIFIFITGWIVQQKNHEMKK